VLNQETHFSTNLILKDELKKINLKNLPKEKNYQSKE
jgi:hypothetical protein